MDVGHSRKIEFSTLLSTEKAIRPDGFLFGIRMPGSKISMTGFDLMMLATPAGLILSRWYIVRKGILDYDLSV